MFKYSNVNIASCGEIKKLKMQKNAKKVLTNG